MIDVKIVRKDFRFQTRDQFVRISRRFRRIASEAREQFLRFTLRANRRVAHAGKMLNEEIDYSISNAAHFVFGKFETWRIRFIAHASL